MEIHANTLISSSLFRIARKVLNKRMGVWVLFIIFLAGTQWVDAQQNYNINIGISAGGSVYASSPSSPNGSFVPVGETVTLTVTEDLGHELKGIVGYNTHERQATVTLIKTGGGYRFVMPDYDVTISATFGYTDDQQTVINARNTINASGAPTFVQEDVYNETTLKAALVTAINDILTNQAIIYTVVAEDISLANNTFPITGTVENTQGGNGAFSFIVKLKIGANTTEEITNIISGVITATPYDNTQDNADITAVKQIIEAITFADTQANISTLALAKAKVLAVIGGLNLNGVSTAIVDETYTPAVAGTVPNLSGTDGSYTFKVELTKGGGDKQTTTELTLTITATPYDPTQDNADLAAAKIIVEGATYTANQTDALNQSQAKSKVAAIIAGLNLNGVSKEVVDGLFTAAVEGTVGSLNGTDGNYSFTVRLNKGAGTEVITGVLWLSITAIPYDPAQDEADILAAKALIESTDYVAMQLTAPDMAKAKEAVEAIISMLPLKDVTANVVDDDFEGATEGTAGLPEGMDGWYKFTVELSKGAGAPQTTVLLILDITATPYTPPDTYLITIALSTYGTVTATPTNPVHDNIPVTLTVTPAEGYRRDAINVYKSSDINEAVILTGGDNIRYFVMPAYDVTVAATFTKTDDQNDVEEAIRLINDMGIVTLLQDDAHSEELVKMELVQMINDLTGMNATGIIVEMTDISINTFQAATEGTYTNITGSNGNFTYIVTLQKPNSVLMMSNVKTGVITATAYDPASDNDDIAAAKIDVENATYVDYQVNILTQVQAKASVEAIISGFSLYGVTTEVVDGVFIAASEGTVSTPSGGDGSFTFTVKLNKGGGTEVITDVLKLHIYATGYNSSQDINDIMAAKALIETTGFIATQMNAGNITQAKAAVETILSTLSLNGVTTNVLNGAFVAATAGTVGTPNGSNGYYTFAVELNKGPFAQIETEPLTMLITATPFTPSDTYLIHITLSTHGTVTANTANPVSENANVTLTVAPAEGYELDLIKACKSDDITEIVPLAGTGLSRTLQMPAYDVKIEATFNKTADQSSVEDAIQLINEMTNISILQTTANTEADVKSELTQIINGLPGMSATGNTVTDADILLYSFTAATEGTGFRFSGDNGSFTFIVVLKKNNSATMSSTLKSGVLIATFYDPTQDNLDIATARTVIEGAAYIDIQANIQTLANAKAAVEAIIAGLPLGGVTAEVVDGLLTAADEGTATMPNGTVGSYTFTVKLNKGGGTEVITNVLTLTITATPYDATQDDNDILSAKALVEGAIYETTQINAPDMAKAKEAVEAIISTLALQGVTADVINDDFLAATAGVAATPNGTDGFYKFTVELNKGAGTMETTTLLTLTITATPHTPTNAYILNISLTTHGTVSSTTTNPVDENDAVTLTVTPAAGYELDDITAFKTNDATTPVTLTGTDATRTFPMPPFDVTVEATFTKTTDQLDVETAIGLINSLSNTSVLQETANDETTVKSWLALLINNLPGMDVTGIIVNANDITIDGFNPATTGTALNPAGANGSFTFFVTLTINGSATEKSTVKSGVIIATEHSAIKYSVTIEPTVNGTVTPSQTDVTVGTTVLLNIIPAQGYELDIISAYKTGDAGTNIPLAAVGTSREFTMPAYDVTVYTTFSKNADQLDVEMAKTAIENMNNPTVSMATANTEAAVKAWLALQINALPGVSDNGIVVTVSNITFISFTAAVAGSGGNATGTNGSFTFTVSLRKNGSMTVATTSKNGVITATGFDAPLYSIYFNTMTNGAVTVVRDYAAEGETVTLTITPDKGYQLESLTVSPSVTINGSGFIRTFVMPANYVIFSATFKKTQEQLDKETLATLAAAIEGGSYRIAQSTGNTQATIHTWLVNTLGVMFGHTHNIELRALVEEPIIGDVTVTTLTPAAEGTTSTPSGANGAFAFTVSLQLGAETLTTVATDGTIVAMPYPATPLKRVDLLQLNELTVRILNTGNVETGALNLALTGANADVFTLPATTTGSLPIGSEADIVLSLHGSLDIGVYKANVVVSGENLTTTSIEITFTVTSTGNDNLQTNPLRAWTQNGVLYVSGLTVGQPWSVYSISGLLIHHSITGSEDARIAIRERGVYIVISGTNTVKVVL